MESATFRAVLHILHAASRMLLNLLVHHFSCSSSDVNMDDVSGSDGALSEADLVSTTVLERDPTCFCYEL